MSILFFVIVLHVNPYSFLKDLVFDPRPAPVVSKKQKSKVVMKCRRIFEKMPYGCTRMFMDLNRFTRPLDDGTMTWVNLWNPNEDLQVSESEDDQDGM
jgi:hypothetical protein